MKEGGLKRGRFEDNFGFLDDKIGMNNTRLILRKPESTPVIQEEFDKSAGTKKKVFEFLQIRNLTII